MSDRYQRRFSKYSIFFLLIVIILVVGAIWQYQGMMQELDAGPRKGLVGRITGRDNPSDVHAMPGLNIALIRSEDTALTMGNDQDNYYDIVSAWQTFLSETKFNYATLPRIPLGADADAYNMMILPATTCISDPDANGIKAFMKQGKGVLMTWATGVRDQQGRWRKYSLLQEICGIDTGEPPPDIGRGISSFVLLNRPPIGSAAAPGLSLDLTRYDQPMSARVVEERTSVDGVWNREAGPRYVDALLLPEERAAMVHGDYFAGRFVWFGFPFASGVGLPEQTAALRTVTREAILWAAHQVRADKPVWPSGHSCVMSLTVNVREPIDLNPFILALVRRHHIALTVFVETDLAMRDPDLLLSAAEAGEVALLADVNTADQLNRKYLKRVRKQVKSVTGQNPIGFRVGGTVSDDAYEALVRAGFEYISTPEFDRVVPKIVRSYRPIPFLTRPRFLWLVPEMQTLKEMTSSGFSMDKLSQVMALGGYYCLSIDSQDHQENTKWKIDQLINLANSENVWITTVGEMKHAWAWWDNIKIVATPSAPGKTTIQISNTGLYKARGIGLRIEMPNPVDDLEIQSMLLGTEVPTLSSVDGTSWDFRLKTLGAGKNVSYTIKPSSVETD